MQLGQHVEGGSTPSKSSNLRSDDSIFVFSTETTEHHSLHCGFLTVGSIFDAATDIESANLSHNHRWLTRAWPNALSIGEEVVSANVIRLYHRVLGWAS
jgi:hypothetical protein